MANWFEKIKTGAFRKEVTCKNCGKGYNPVEHQDCPHCELMRETVIMSPAEAAKARGGPSLISRYVAENDASGETGQGGLIDRYGGLGDDEATSVSQAVNGLIERFSGDGPGSAPNGAVGGGDEEATQFFTPAPAGVGSSWQEGAHKELPGQETTGEQAGPGSRPAVANEVRPEFPGLDHSLSLEFDQGLFSSGELDLPGPVRSGKAPSEAVKSSVNELADDASNPVNWGTIKFDAAELTQASVNAPDESQRHAGLMDEGLAAGNHGATADVEMNFSELLGDEAPIGMEQSSDDLAEAVAGASPTNAGGAVSAHPGATDKTVISTAHRARGVVQEKLPAEAIADDPVVGWIVVVDGPGKGYSRPLGSGINSIGRSPDQQVPLYFGAASDKEVSRSDHLHVVYDTVHNTFKLQHGKSRNLSYLNDHPVLEITELKPYDRVRIGNTTLVFVPFCGDKFTW